MMLKLIYNGEYVLMDNDRLDQCFEHYLHEVKTWSPDRMIEIDLEALQRLDLLSGFHEPFGSTGELTQYFQVSESPEKITLMNEQFVIWIVPEVTPTTTVTYVFIALNTIKKPRLEVSFSASGVYNSSKLVMRVLEKMLSEIEENEALLSRYTGAA